MADTDTAPTIFEQLRTVIPAEHHGLLADVIAHMTELHAENIRLRQNIMREIKVAGDAREECNKLRERIGQLQVRAGFYKNDARLKQEEINRLRNQFTYSDRRLGVTDEH